MNPHQQKQKEVIDTIEKQVQNNIINFSTVAPVDDYEKDTRIALTSVHFPRENLLTKIQETIIQPLKEIEPSYYYYQAESLHLTIKNIRVINDPPQFRQNDIEKAKHVFSEIIPNHTAFSVYFLPPTFIS